MVTMMALALVYRSGGFIAKYDVVGKPLAAVRNTIQVFDHM